MLRSRRFTLRIVVIVLASLVCLALLGSPARADGPFVVTTNVDYNPGAVDGTCYYGVVEGCGLREAIKEAFASSNKTITFHSSLAGQIFYLTAAYGPLVVAGSGISIDATSTGNYITIDGSGLYTNTNVIEIQGNNNTLRHVIVRGLMGDNPATDGDHGHGIKIYDPSSSGSASNNTLDDVIVWGNRHNGIVIVGDSAGGGNGNTIAHSLIGAPSWLNTSCPTTGDPKNDWDGILIAGGADNTDINSNTIVCNGLNGVYLWYSSGTQISGTVIQTNKIGTDGTNAMGNGAAGIHDWAATGTQIFNNVVSGNGNHGIWLEGSDHAALTTNRIGTNQTGSAAVANSWEGVSMSDGAHDNTLGSATVAASRNIIGGNSGSGVGIITGANSNVLDGNYIGLGTDGSTVIPNGLAGVAVIGANNIALSSGSGSPVNQFISGNTREGVYVLNALNVSVNHATYIGVAADTVTEKGNGLQGVFLDTGTTYAYIRPGKVMYNGEAGIAVVGDTSVGNELLPQMIGYNGGLPIDLGNDGHTSNDPGDSDTGPNGLLNYPEPTTVNGSNIAGTACPGCYVYIYRAIGNPAAKAGGGTLLTQVTADSAGVWNATLTGGLTAGDITLLAYDGVSTINTSEMRPRLQVFLPLVLKN